LPGTDRTDEDSFLAGFVRGISDGDGILVDIEADEESGRLLHG
jgi:hypothetical protein